MRLNGFYLQVVWNLMSENGNLATEVVSFPLEIYIQFNFIYYRFNKYVSKVLWLTLRFLDRASAVSCQDKSFQIWHHVQDLLFTVL